MLVHRLGTADKETLVPHCLGDEIGSVCIKPTKGESRAELNEKGKHKHRADAFLAAKPGNVAPSHCLPEAQDS